MRSWRFHHADLKWITRMTNWFDWKVTLEVRIKVLCTILQTSCTSHCVFPGPLCCNIYIFWSVSLVYSCYIWYKWVIGIRITQQRTYGQQNWKRKEGTFTFVTCSGKTAMYLLFYSTIVASSIFEPTQGGHTWSLKKFFFFFYFSPFLYMQLPPPFARAGHI
jgi:hypothetical protein